MGFFVVVVFVVVLEQLFIDVKIGNEKQTICIFPFPQLTASCVQALTVFPTKELCLDMFPAPNNM